VSESDRAVNAAAVFHPFAVHDDGTQALPAVEVAGVLVFAYVQDGQLRVSVDLDTAAGPGGPFTVVPGREDEVPMTITVQGTPVFSAGPRSAPPGRRRPPGARARPLPRSGETRTAGR
jgi:hypothetical protein